VLVWILSIFHVPFFTRINYASGTPRSWWSSSWLKEPKNFEFRKRNNNCVEDQSAGKRYFGFFVRISQQRPQALRAESEIVYASLCV
jgi:hypothetical protein